MKKVIINNYTKFHTQDDYNPTETAYFEGEENLEVSDSYHTMDELYHHRIIIYIALCNVIAAGGYFKNPEVWRSKLHSDGTSFDGWFVLGINKEAEKQITYHLPLSEWSQTDFAETLDKAPEFDGHTAEDVLERLKHL